MFSNTRLTFIVREKSLKFVAISAGAGRNCGQAYRSFTATRERITEDGAGYSARGRGAT
jgi:hypothetical protein